MTTMVLGVVFFGVDADINRHFRRSRSARNDAIVLHDYIRDWFVSILFLLVTFSMTSTSGGHRE